MAAARLSLLVLLALALVLPASGAEPGGGAFNVTEILGRFPEFSLFNLLLGKAHVDRDINSRNAVTVLVPDNSAVDWLLRRSARLPRAALVELLSVHVVLDYIDAAKLAKLPRGRPTVSTTLFQTTGKAARRTGFLAITPTARGGAVFASAAPGALVNATFKKAVTAVPYNISVLEISNFVVPPGVITRPRMPPPSPRMKPTSIAPSPAPVPAPTRVLPTLPSSPLTDPADEEADEAPATAPAPSHGHSVKVMSWWSGLGVAVGMACMFGYL
ncbi:fasciclin-like arabinogalactan protein 3 [Oryza brachyantha]|uniref:fasciclin-like arabinogalactan protein 3 n=1 Tax=Oryza brachyantha TaxID=4533 RepID=UPI001ADBFEA7|nr:fasciclin-like arabinogalactan protein 3 [Oryza brachyantha]